MGNVIQVKRGDTAPPSGALLPGEFGMDMSTNEVYIGTKNGEVTQVGVSLDVKKKLDALFTQSEYFVFYIDNNAYIAKKTTTLRDLPGCSVDTWIRQQQEFHGNHFTFYAGNPAIAGEADGNIPLALAQGKSSKTSYKLQKNGSDVDLSEYFFAGNQFSLVAK